MSDPSISRRIRCLTRSLTTARPRLLHGEKRAAGDGRPSLGLRPRSGRPPPALSHPDCRSRLTLIVARQVIPDHALGAPVLLALSLCTCCRHYPGTATGVLIRSLRPSRVSLPRYGSQVGPCIVLFEACSAFTRVTACTLALSPYIVTRYPKASATSLPP
jgi:hypothetical protein